MILSDALKIAGVSALIGASVAAGVYLALAAQVNQRAQEDSDATREWYNNKVETKLEEIRDDMVEASSSSKDVHIYPNFFKEYDESMMEADFIREKLDKLGLNRRYTNDLDVEWSTQEAFSNIKSDYDKIHCTYFTDSGKLVVNDTGEVLDQMDSVGLYYAIYLSATPLANGSAIYISNNYNGQDFVITIANQEQEGGGKV